MENGFGIHKMESSMNALKLPLIFQNGMVLQRRKPICVWGQAPKGRLVTARIADKTAMAIAENGEFIVYLPPIEAGSGYTLTISDGISELSYTDIAIGEVWLAGGQSNMEFLLRDDADAATAMQTNCADIRCFEVPKISYPGQECDRDYSTVGIWRKAREQDTAYFTAVGFYFAHKLYRELQVPVGVINCTWGGTSASAYVAKEYLTGRLQVFLDNAYKAQAALDPATEFERFVEHQKTIDSMPFDNRVANLAPIVPDPAMCKAMEHMKALHLSRYSPFRPGGLYETMLKPIAHYSISGVIWYQGESDEPTAPLYEELMQAMITCWRMLWHETLPFFQVQLASFEEMVEPLNFVPIRAAQERLTKNMEKVWLASAIDVGMRYDIHPKRKQPVGERLALQALSKVYGRAILADSPTVEGVHRAGTTLRFRFANTGLGLVCRGETPQTFDVTVGQETLPPYDINVCGNEISISASEFASGERITVSFCQYPYCENNMYNSAGLPVLPFACTID